MTQYEFYRHKAKVLGLCFRCGAKSNRLHCGTCLQAMRKYTAKRLRYPGTGRGANNRGRAWGNGVKR